MRGKTSANLAVWISAGPRDRDCTRAKWDSKFPGSSRADRPNRETPKEKTKRSSTAAPKVTINIMPKAVYSLPSRHHLIPS